MKTKIRSKICKYTILSFLRISRKNNSEFTEVMEKVITFATLWGLKGNHLNQ